MATNENEPLTTGNQPLEAGKQPLEERKPFVFATPEPTFEIVEPLLVPPLEISRDQLPLLNMVDENIIVHGKTIKPKQGDADARKTS